MNARLRSTLFTLTIALVLSSVAFGQSTASLQGTVTDSSGAALANAKVVVRNEATGVERSTQTSSAGLYQVPALPVGTYTLEVQAAGMQPSRVKGVVLDVNSTVTQDVSLKVGSVSQEVTITAEQPVIDSSTITFGSSVNQQTVQEIPLNGRHFVDLASLVPGTVVPPVQNSFLTAPLRGQGAFAIVTAGDREDTTNFMINGINLNDMANGQITFQPSINTVAEFKIDNSTPSAEYGRNSGATVNIATRSGSNTWHGEAFEFLRNEDLDARNFFNKENDPITGAKVAKNAFKRNQFGGAVGGPIWKNHTFFFASYEGLRQRQGLALSSSVPSAAQIATVTDPTIKKLLALVPAGTGGNATTAASFSGAAVAPVNIDQGTGDVSHNFSDNDRLHGYYVFQRDQRGEPNLSGATVPGGGDARRSHRQIFTLNETHVFSPNLVNDLRLGFNRIRIQFAADVQSASLDPSTFGIADGLTGPIGIPQIIVNPGSQLVFGGERNFPQGRGDLTSVLSENVSYLRGRHSFKFGGEYRRFNGNSIAADEGSISFGSMADFLAAKPNAFAINLGGSHPARTTEQAFGLFAMDSFKVKPYFTLELGLRWEFNKTPTEAFNRSSVFLPAKAWLVQLGTNGINDEYHQNNKLFQPRVGFSWDVFHNGKTVVRSGYGLMYDEPLPIISSGNPPFGLPLSFTSGTGGKANTSFSTLLPDAAGSLTITSANPNYNDAYLQSWNLNVQQEVTPTLGIMVGYFGSKGTHLNQQININQLIQNPTGAPGSYVRPITNLAADSPIIPVAPSGAKITGLGNVTSNESSGNSNYNALWVTATKRVAHGLQFNANYTWSKSIDTNSRNFQGTTVQNNLTPLADRAVSDFDARHHFTISGIYDVPFKSNRLVAGWRLSTAITLQSGNPLNVTSGSPSTGTGNAGFTGNATIRPDLIGPLPSVGSSLITTGANAGFIQWFPTNIQCDPTRAGSCSSSSVFAIPLQVVTTGGVARNVYHFGNLSRNALLGPDFKNMDLSISKTTKITERLSHELRVEAFDLFNHPNLSNRNTSVSSLVGNANFGVIKATRGPTGDAGSSRQIQFAMKLIF